MEIRDSDLNLVFPFIQKKGDKHIPIFNFYSKKTHSIFYNYYPQIFM